MSRTHRLAVHAGTLMAAAALVGCTSSTYIRTDPPGARLFINGSSVGTTPYYYTDSQLSFSKVNVRMEKEGYETLQINLSRDETVEVANLVAAVCCPLVLPFAMGYHPEHYYVLRPLRDAPSEDWEEQVSPERAPPGGKPPADWSDEELPELPEP